MSPLDPPIILIYLIYLIDFRYLKHLYLLAFRAFNNPLTTSTTLYLFIPLYFVYVEALLNPSYFHEI